MPGKDPRRSLWRRRNQLRPSNTSVKISRKMARLDNPNDLEMPAFRNSCPICKVENTAEIRSWPFSDRELCCTIGIRTFLFGMVSFSNFHFTKRERCFSVKNEIFQEKILALSRLSTDFQGAKVE